MKRSGTARPGRMLQGVALLLSTVLLAGCGSSGTAPATTSGTPAGPATTSAADPDATADSDATGAAAACGRLPAARPDLIGQLPAGFATLAGWQPTEVVDQGRTRVVRGVLPGEPADLQSVRDRAADRLAGAGYRRTGSDAEPGFEAEADLAGPHEVNVAVRALCRGYLVLSYTVQG